MYQHILGPLLRYYDKSSVFGFSVSWACVHCQTEYDREDIEQLLIDALHRTSMALVLQDLKCVKCKQVSTSLKE